MKRLILAGVAGLAALTMMQSANAADIARRQAMPTKAPAYFAPYNWSGFYIGINVVADGATPIGPTRSARQARSTPPAA